MSRLEIRSASNAQNVADSLCRDMERRLSVSPPGLCPVELSMSFLQLCQAQSCGKCTPCRVGLGQLSALMGRVLDGNADADTLNIIEKTAKSVADTADCAIGREAGRMALTALAGFRDDFESHISAGRCAASRQSCVPCRSLCPAGVDIPGYTALVRAGRCADAVRLIRKDNPMPVACAYICEHPCEARCRRGMVDAPLNIRGLKRYAVDQAGGVPQPAAAESTGKRVAVVGGGPSGLTCAYYLALMGHQVTIYESKKKLGGMLRYGIPSYRFPREKLDAEIKSILSVGIEARTGVAVGKELSLAQLREDYDCVYLAIGAQQDKKAGIPGEDSEGVLSAVELLGMIGDGNAPDFTGKNVAVVGGGNVAMDATRTAVRLGAKKVSCVYRRRQDDMTALPEEIEGAAAEGAEMVTLAAPVRVEADEEGRAVALWAQPQLIGAADSSGRPSVSAADEPELRIPADVIIMAVGQAVDSASFADAGMPTRKGAFVASADGAVSAAAGVFAGGDCVTGPATAIRAIAAGKTAAANIDEYLGFHHEISVDVEIPAPTLELRPPYGRANLSLRSAEERKCDFEDIECGLSREAAEQEASRCLHCDHFGYGAFKGGRIEKW